MGELKSTAPFDNAPPMVVAFMKLDGTVQRVDENNPLPGAGGGGGGAANDRELITLVFRVTTAFSGASVGDLLTMTQILDVDGAASSVSTIWRNQTTGADLGAAPSFANLELAGGSGGTIGGSTAARQDIIIGHIDQLEAALTTLVGHVDQLETKLDAANESLDAMQAAVTSNAAAEVVGAPIGCVSLAAEGGVKDVDSSAIAITVPAGTRYVQFFNRSANTIWLNPTGGAATIDGDDCIPIPPYSAATGAGSWTSAPGFSGALSIISTGSGNKFTCLRYS